jgi:hypothetical protein
MKLPLSLSSVTSTDFFLLFVPPGRGIGFNTPTQVEASHKNHSNQFTKARKKEKVLQ